jgi:hypothetical protein
MRCVRRFSGHVHADRRREAAATALCRFASYTVRVRTCVPESSELSINQSAPSADCLCSLFNDWGVRPEAWKIDPGQMCKASFCNSRTRGTLSSEKQKGMVELFESKTYTEELLQGRHC